MSKVSANGSALTLVITKTGAVVEAGLNISSTDYTTIQEQR